MGPRSRNRRLRCWLIGAAACGLLACAPEEPAPGWIELVQARPRLREGVFLNEPLTLHFSAPVDQASVTRESLRVRSVDGAQPAEGRIEVMDETVRFIPDLPRRPDLSDAGFRAGTRYEVEVRGFPYPDGVRSEDGRPLVATYRWSFDTAMPADDDQRVQLFDDRTPGWAAPLRPRTLSVPLDQPILLECEEPIDPRTLGAAGFQLRPEGTGERIRLDARLAANSDAGERPGQGRTVLELRPRAPLEPRIYLLGQARGGLRDFGGNPVLLHGDRTLELRIQVVPAGPSELHVETFLGTAGRSPVAVPGVDGTAHWAGDGLVRVRLPAAAGDGGAGRVELDGTVEDADVHAVSLHVPPDATATLSAGGLVVLRAQGSLVIDGRLERAQAGPAALGELEPAVDETLSSWLARAGELDAGWTVLVAGGDLVVRGELEVDGPLLLVAGGMLRIPASGRVSSGSGYVRLLGSGGGPGLPSTAGRLALEIDEPSMNPLREPLSFAVLSGPIPATGGVTRWVDSFVEGETREGGYEVFFVPDAPSYDEPFDEWGAQAHAAGLGDASRLRILVRLEVVPPAPDAAGAPWRPPVVDDVILVFERAAIR